jgi:predicted double-glycine peptidase
MKIEATRSAIAKLASVIVMAASCTACHSPLIGSVREDRLRETGDYHLVDNLDVPAVRGPEGCGAQALAAVLAFSNPAADAGALAEQLPWQNAGATPVDLLLAARERGYQAKIARGSWEALAEQTSGGRPVLVMIDAALEVRTLLMPISAPRVMHWAVVSGVARDGSRILLAARRARHHVVGRDDFLRRWSKSANCMLIVSRDRDGPAAMGGSDS